MIVICVIKSELKMPANDQLNVDLNIDDVLSSVPVSSGSEDEDSSINESKYTRIRTPVQSTQWNDKRYASLPNKNEHETFIRNSIEELLNSAVFNATDRKNKVLEWKNPEDLQNIFDMKLKDTPDSDEVLLNLIKDTIKYSVKTGHPYFVNQLFSGVDPYGLIGQFLTDALNPSVYTYEVSPVFTLMEEVVLKEMRKIVGFPNGDGDGIFCPGGSMANGYAISCARYHFMPDVKVKLKIRV